MLDWQSLGDDRTTDPDWETDYHRGTAIGLLLIVALAVVVVIGTSKLVGSEIPGVTQLYPEWPA